MPKENFPRVVELVIGVECKEVAGRDNAKIAKNPPFQGRFVRIPRRRTFRSPAVLDDRGCEGAWKTGRVRDKGGFAHKR
jgi:hypothetical protein